MAKLVPTLVMLIIQVSLENKITYDVQVWFCNRRQKWKKQVQRSADELSSIEQYAGALASPDVDRSPKFQTS